MDMANTIALLLGGAFWLVLIGGMAYRLLRDRVTRKKKTRAQILRKRDSTCENFTQFGALGRRHITSFMLECRIQGKVRTFEVSPLLYDRVEAGQEGLLTYQGSRGIDWE